MLCPDVSNFKEPSSIFHGQRVEKNNIRKTLENFNFIHSVTVILPDTLKISDSFGLELTYSDYYKLQSLNINELVTETFLGNFVHCGGVSLLSINTRIDCDDCVAITPAGKLILNLNKVTYQTLGIEGKSSHFHSLNKEKYIVTVDLKADSFKPGKTNYERVKSCLKKLHDFNVILTWEPPEKELCPSSIAKYFFDLGFQIEVCKISRNVFTRYSVKVPVISDFENFDKDCEEFIEWLGLIAINGCLEDEANYISSYMTPEPFVYSGQVKILTWKGFFNYKMIESLLEGVEKFQQGSEFWKAIYFQGFSDSPVSWGSNEHHYYTNGDNGGIILLNKNEYFMCLQKCSRNRYK